MAEVEKKTRTVKRVVTKEVEEQEEYYQLTLSKKEMEGIATLLICGISEETVDALHLDGLMSLSWSLYKSRPFKSIAVVPK